MAAVTAVSGSGPAYVFMVIEAMADAGVREGLTRTAALELAAQTVLGSAKMVMETGKHPAELRRYGLLAGRNDHRCRVRVGRKGIAFCAGSRCARLCRKSG